MTKFEKTVQKIRQNPKTVSFDDLDNILQRYGFACRQPSGGSSHYIYTFNGQAIYRQLPYLDTVRM